MAAPEKKFSAYWLPVNPDRPSHVSTGIQWHSTTKPAGGNGEEQTYSSGNLLLNQKLNTSNKFYPNGTWVDKSAYLFKNLGNLSFCSSIKPSSKPTKSTSTCKVSFGKSNDIGSEQPENTFSQELLQAQEQERQNLANELHDSLGQSVILMKNHILKLKNNLPESTETIEQINTLAEMVTDTLQKIREISYGLRPYELNLFGLTHAIRTLTEDIADAEPWHLTLELPKIDNVFLKEHEIHVYRVLQQCLEVIQKQAAAKKVKFKVQVNADTIEWNIQVTGWDNFCQYLKNNINADFNLLRLQEQLKIVSGSITFNSTAPEVTTIHLTIPIQPTPKTYEKA